MKLKELLKGIEYQVICGNLDEEIIDITYNSKQAKKQVAFVALIGIDHDGHDYIEDAIKNGATSIIVSKDISPIKNITIIKIKDTRKELSTLSANLFNNPQEHLIKIAITGTKGKTSTAFMIKQILERAEQKVGVIGTIGTFINNKLYTHKNTTPESYYIQKFMRQMVDEKVKYLIMEVSSQALKVGRVNNITFDYAIFTNLSIDHIGPREHPTYEDYRNSKASLFKMCKVGIFNKDDIEFENMTKDATCKIYTYGKKQSDLTISNIKQINSKDFLGIEWKANEVIERVSSPGIFSSYNASGAILLCKLLKINDDIIKQALMTFHAPGRCEIINIHNKFKIIIDFAHNKISMESIIKTMREYHPNRIITIFGCGGGRSHDRRYELGEISGALSDLSIITTDNPRNDNIDDINKDIEDGIKSKHGNYLIIKDREEAIHYAINNACKNDIILLLGKGHENYQEIKGKIYPFNEKEIIQKYINN